jgi:hypothetical protein
MILFYPKDEKLFMVCFSFAEVWEVRSIHVDFWSAPIS